MKKIITGYICMLYLMQLFLILGIVAALNRANHIWIMLGISLFLGVISIILGLVNIVISLTRTSGLLENIPKTVMVAKITLMPFFIINFVICFLIIGAFLNPFLFLGVFVVVPILIFLTYLVLLSTSSYNIAYIMRKLKSKERTLNELLIYIVFHFIFGLDVIGSIVLFLKSKKGLI